jgi:hypothetical protein
MKKKYSELKVYKSDKFDDIPIKFNLDFPFNEEFIKLLKKENHFPQEYYLIKNKEDFAFFIVYKMKLNIFTFGKLKLHVWVNVIGIPCSISENGYYTNNEELMLDYIKTIKGAKLVLNVKSPVEANGITVGNTLPTCVFVNNFNSIDEYVASLRSSYRRRIKKAIRACKDLEIEQVRGCCYKNVYDLYLNTYQKSSYKLEKLEKGFFNKVEADKIVFSKNDIELGFVLLKKHQDTLYFMLCGMNYDVDTADLYYFMLYKIIAYAIENKCKYIDFGQTSEETKLKMGSELSQRFFYAHHSNKILNKFININKGILEYKYNFKKFNVYKKE